MTTESTQIPTTMTANQHRLCLALLILAILAVKAWLMDLAGLELHFDEAQYWEWSQHLDWGYYSKGPLVAWLIALSTGLFGHGEWQIRLPGWLAHGAFLATVYQLGLLVANHQRAAWWALALAASTPLYFMLGLVMTTDTLLLLCWSTALLALYRALILKQSKAWYVAGLALGGGLLAKFTIALLAAIVALLVVATPRYRPQLRNPHLWGGLILALILVSPLLIWNNLHDWVTLRHNFGHIGTSHPPIYRLVDYIAGQMLALSPLIAALIVVANRWPPTSPGPRLLWWIGVLGIVVILLKASSSDVKLNWAAPVYLALIVLFANQIARMNRRRHWLLGIGVASSLTINGVMLFPSSVGIPAHIDPFTKLKQWREPILQLSQRPAQPIDFILADSYPLASELAIYWPSSTPVYLANPERKRHNQRDLWPGLEQEQGQDGLYVSLSAEIPATIRAAFARCIPLEPVEARNRQGILRRTLYAQHCQRYRHTALPTPQHY